MWTAAGVLLSAAGYLAYRGYMESRVNTPLAAHKVAYARLSILCVVLLVFRMDRASFKLNA